jgi:hypothetical protein
MSRIRIVKGTITKTTGGNHNMYSEGNIVFNSAKSITEVGVENGIVFGDPEPVPIRETKKKIVEMYWTYGDTKLSDKSKFYADMNLIVKTENYNPGERIVIRIKNDDGQALTDERNELIFSGAVGEDNMVIFEEILKNFTLNILTKNDVESDPSNEQEITSRNQL